MNLEKQPKEIESVDQQIAQMMEAGATENEILDRCELKAALPETISVISSHLPFKESKNSDKHMQSIKTQGQFPAVLRLIITINITIFSNLIDALTALFFTNYCVGLKLDSWL